MSTTIKQALEREPMIHELKTHPEPFQAVKDGSKPFEWRKDDRDYRVGDTLWLREWDPAERTGCKYGSICTKGCMIPQDCDHEAPIGYTGDELHRKVTYIIREGFGIPDGYCIMGLAELSAPREEGRNYDPAEAIPKSWLKARSGRWPTDDQPDDSATVRQARAELRRTMAACGWDIYGGTEVTMPLNFAWESGFLQAREESIRLATENEGPSASIDPDPHWIQKKAARRFPIGAGLSEEATALIHELRFAYESELKNAAAHLSGQSAKVEVCHERFGGQWVALFSIGNQSFHLLPIHGSATEKSARWQAEMLRSAFGLPRIGDAPEGRHDMDAAMDLFDEDPAPSVRTYTQQEVEEGQLRNLVEQWASTEDAQQFDAPLHALYLFAKWLHDQSLAANHGLNTDTHA